MENMGLRGQIFGPLWVPKLVKIPVFGTFLTNFSMVSYQSYHFGPLLEVSEAQFPGHFGPQIYHNSGLQSFSQTFSIGVTSFMSVCLLGVLLCVLQ